MSRLRRSVRWLLATVALAGCCAGPAIPPEAADTEAPRIITVRGFIAAAALGRTLAHEHVTTDFLGAEKAPQPRYDMDAAFATILPSLQRLKSRGVTALIECTPAHIGRDPILLRRLAEASGLHLITNTGYYGAVGNKFLPRHAHTESIDELAARWEREFRDGIDSTGVRPGFIKLGVEAGKLPPLHEKLLRAAARVHTLTGLTIAVHSGDGEAARDERRILAEEGVGASALIWVHAQNGPQSAHLELARQGVWISLDGVSQSSGNIDRHVGFLVALRQAGLLHRVLISHDDGWAVEGEAAGTTAGLKLFNNGNPEPYSTIFTDFLPRLRQVGFTPAELDQILIVNPREALALRVRRI